jgi:hypothetical protein
VLQSGRPHKDEEGSGGRKRNKVERKKIKGLREEIKISRV